MRSAALLVLACTLFASGEGVADQIEKPCVRVFDGLLHENKPELSRLSMQPISVFGAVHWWPPRALTTDLPKVGLLEQWVFNEVPQKVLAIDLEFWPLTGDGPHVAETVRKMQELIFRLRGSGFRNSIGYYQVLPTIDYWRAIKEEDSSEYKEWQRENDLLAPLVPSVDVLFPSLYTFYDDRPGWVAYARANIAEARRISSGKPLYVFLWPQYHNSNTTQGLEYIDYDYWMLQLTEAATLADGIVLWGGITKDVLPDVWNPTEEWWVATVRFMTTSPQVCRDP